MKAIVIQQPGPPEVLKLAERPTPTLKPEEVLIEVKAAGINRPDIFQRKGNYPAPSDAPQDIPGLEVAGIIAACGEKASRWQVGDAVCALLPGGGYAEFAVVNHRHCLPVPANYSFEEAASLPETIFTVWHNVFQRGRLKRGESLLVHGGSSGIGITAIQLAHILGSQVFITAGNEEKCRKCEELGANVAINYREEDFEQVLSTKGVDVILDMIGGDYTEKNLRLLKPDGRLIFINAMNGNDMHLNIRDIMIKRLSISGSTLRARDAAFKAELTQEIEDMVWPLLNEAKFRPIIHKVFSLEDAYKAHQLMESNKHIGKIILKVA